MCKREKEKERERECEKVETIVGKWREPQRGWSKGGKRKLPEADLAIGLTALSRCSVSSRDPLNDPAIRRTTHFDDPFR